MKPLRAAEHLDGDERAPPTDGEHKLLVTA